LLAGGASLNQDRRILNMVLVLTVLFIITVALSAAIPFLNDLLLMDWLNPVTDYVIIAAIVVVWAGSLLLIWRIWRIPGLEINGDTSSEKKAENHSPDKTDADQSEEELPQLTA
jgi:hypothetical protein